MCQLTLSHPFHPAHFNKYTSVRFSFYLKKDIKSSRAPNGKEKKEECEAIWVFEWSDVYAFVNVYDECRKSPWLEFDLKFKSGIVQLCDTWIFIITFGNKWSHFKNTLCNF